MTLYANILRMGFWYAVFLFFPFVTEFVINGRSIYSPSEGFFMTLGVIQVALQLGAVHYCLRMGTKRWCRSTSYVLAGALLLMVFRRMTAFLIMFDMIEPGSLVPVIDKLFLPLGISALLFAGFFLLNRQTN